MEFAFNEEQQALQQSVREVLADKAGPRAYRDAMRSETGCDEALWRTITELGWTGVGIDESLGGLGLGLVELVILQEEMGRALAAAPFFSTVAFAAQLVGGAEPSQARDRFLRAVAGGERRAAAVVEGASAAGGRLSGTLKVPEAHVADDLVVAAGDDVFIVPVDAMASKPPVLPSLDGGRRLASVALDGIAAEPLPGGKIVPALDRVAVLLAAEGVGVAQAALDMAVAYAKERDQFGKKIGSFQAISHRCADMLTLVENARSHVYYAAWALEEGTPDAHLASAAAKAAAADAARVCPNDAIQIHGGIGFTFEHDMHLYYRRGKFCELFLGDGAIWRERIAAQLAPA